MYTAHSCIACDKPRGTISSLARVYERPRYLPMRSSVQPRLALRAVNFSRGHRPHRSLDFGMYGSDQLWLRTSVLTFSRRDIARPCDRPLAPLDGDTVKSSALEFALLSLLVPGRCADADFLATWLQLYKLARSRSPYRCAGRGYSSKREATQLRRQIRLSVGKLDCGRETNAFWRSYCSLP